MMKLYEFSWFYIDIFMLIPVWMLVVGLISYYIGKKKGKEGHLLFERITLMVFVVIACVFYMRHLTTLVKIGHAYTSGNYQTVEGEIENFVPTKWIQDKQKEQFEINGVQFYYINNEILPAYHKAASHGGVITREGQRLRIKYVIDSKTGRNIIVYIEQLEDEAE